jgi:hypothetical protein
MFTCVQYALPRRLRHDCETMGLLKYSFIEDLAGIQQTLRVYLSPTQPQTINQQKWYSTKNKWPRGSLGDEWALESSRWLKGVSRLPYHLGLTW